jgi:predicted Rossmann fold flavoprotein
MTKIAPAKNCLDGENPDDIWDVIVIGGGPAGMIAAGRAAERARELNAEKGGAENIPINNKDSIKILLLEKNDSFGKKLLITGGGRCNVTNAELDDRALLSKFKDAGKFLFSTFSQYGVKDTLEFFHSHGMPTKVEAGKRVFPVSDSAKSVRDVLVNYLKGDGDANPVTVKSNIEVTGFIQSQPGIIDGVKIKNKSDAKSRGKSIAAGEIIRGKSFILATGGTSHPETGSTGDGFKWLAKIGHTIIEPSAALVPIKVSDTWVKKLSGISLPNAKLTLFLDGVKQGVGKKGKVLFTHFGLSGPAILNMSSDIGELLKYGEVVLSLDLLPDHDYSTLNEALQRLFTEQNNKKFKNAIVTGKSAGGKNSGLIPSAFVPIILERSGIDGDTQCNSITRLQRLALVKLLKDIHIHPTGLLGADKAIVTSGGVKLEEVDFRTMQSQLIPNLYLVGDVLDIDRPSGGYSLQLCWTTGWVAGDHQIVPEKANAAIDDTSTNSS